MAEADNQAFESHPTPDCSKPTLRGTLDTLDRFVMLPVMTPGRKEANSCAE